MIEGSSFSGLLTRVEIMRIGSDGNGRMRSRTSRCRHASGRLLSLMGRRSRGDCSQFSVVPAFSYYQAIYALYTDN
jgi:hypothetical protein